MNEVLDGDYTHEELDEIFKDDPVFQEAKMRLATMEVRRLLGKDSGSKAEEQYPADATPDQVQQIRAARRAVKLYLSAEDEESQRGSDATPEQVQQIRAARRAVKLYLSVKDGESQQDSDARRAVHATIHPEREKQENPQQANRVESVALAQVKADAAPKNAKINHQSQQVTAADYFPARFFSGPKLSKKPTKEAFQANMMWLFSRGEI